MEGDGFWKKIVCYYSIPASPPTLLMLESPKLYAWYPYAYRWWQRIWNFSKSSSFEIIQILMILPKNAISLVIYQEISSNFLSVWGDVIYIIYQTRFIMWLSDHPCKHYQDAIVTLIDAIVTILDAMVTLLDAMVTLLDAMVTYPLLFLLHMFILMLYVICCCVCLYKTQVTRAHHYGYIRLYNREIFQIIFSLN